MEQIVETILAGVLGTGMMSLVMWLITRSGIANADMIGAIGSIFTRSYENAFTPGLIIHLAAGVVIAFFYVVLISLFSPNWGRCHDRFISRSRIQLPPRCFSGRAPSPGKVSGGRFRGRYCSSRRSYRIRPGCRNRCGDSRYQVFLVPP